MDSESLQIERMSGIEDISGALGLRRQIFIMEQGVAEAREADGLDDAAEHYVGYFLDEAIAVARVRYEDLEVAKLERIGVLEPMRGEGVGRLLMKAILEDLKSEGVRLVTLDSQVHAQEFYKKLGFKTVGEPFIEEGTDIEHIRMEARLDRDPRPLEEIFSPEAMAAAAATDRITGTT